MRGFTINGLVTMAGDGGEAAALTDPVYFAGEDIDAFIANGSWQPGQFARPGIEVYPPVESLPERWRELFGS